MTNVSVELDWLPEPALHIEPIGANSQELRVTAHAGLSHGQVKAACNAMGPQGSHVLDAWERHVGITAS